MIKKRHTAFGARTFRLLRNLESSESSTAPGTSGCRVITFGWEHFAASDPGEIAEQFWGTLPRIIRRQLRALLPQGAAALGKRRKNQRYFLGMKRAAGMLLAWRSSSNTKNRSKFAVIWCERCGRVWEVRMDHFLGSVNGGDDDANLNQSCGCGAEANRERILDTALLHIREGDQRDIAMELELGLKSRMTVAREFCLRNRFFPWLKSGIVLYVLSRIWKRWADGLWHRLGNSGIRKRWYFVMRFGLRAGAAKFGLTIAEMKAVGRGYSRKFGQTKTSVKVPSAPVLDRAA